MEHSLIKPPIFVHIWFMFVSFGSSGEGLAEVSFR
jgi:hypothetical protein